MEEEEEEVSPYEEIVAQQKKVELMNQLDPLGLGPDATSLDFHRAVYRNPALPISTRQRSAIAALQFEHPKLAVHALVDEKSFAFRLDRAIERTAKAISGDVTTNKMIEAKPLRRL